MPSTKVIFTLKNMQCMHCVRTVKNIFEENPAVVAAEVDLSKQQVEITYNPQKINVAQLAELTQDSIYEIVSTQMLA
ncbi:MAG: heavy-metal-associated domain-containing protein [Chitinophagales bacterium]|nr:heavy-metal-associated domain-containing protein [Bacteroidota bacterium]MCB9042437.1 heavy-metal-associated domain-containing protein [Chitinophagales bacterium]